MLAKVTDSRVSISQIPVKILSGQTMSENIPTSGMSLSGIIYPAAFDGATITFVASVDGGETFQQMFKADGTAESIPVSVDGNQEIDYQSFVRVNMVKIVATVQAAERDLIILARSFQ